MNLPAPEWLTRRGGRLQIGHDGSVYVYFANQPQYVLSVLPAGGKHSCAVVQTNNGKRLDRGSTFETVDQAWHGGLEELRQVLGW